MRSTPSLECKLHRSVSALALHNRALRIIAKVTRQTKDPSAGTIDRDANGNPTGVFKEDTAIKIITRLIPPYTREQEKNGLLEIISGFNKEGMTAVKNPGIEESDWSLYQELLHADKLNVRIFALWRGGWTLQSAGEALARVSALPKPPQSFDGMLLSGGIKLFLDGSGGARTAWMFRTGTETRQRSIAATKAIRPLIRKFTARK